MNFLDLVSKYKTILSFVRISNITRDKLKSVLSIMGVSINDDVAQIIAETIKNAGEEKNYKNITDLFTDPEIGTQIAEMVTDIMKSNNEQSVTLSSSPSTDAIQLDSLIKCTHCKKPVHIRSAIARSTQTQEI